MFAVRHGLTRGAEEQMRGGRIQQRGAGAYTLCPIGAERITAPALALEAPQTGLVTEMER